MTERRATVGMASVYVRESERQTYRKKQRKRESERDVSALGTPHSMNSDNGNHGDCHIVRIKFFKGFVLNACDTVIVLIVWHIILTCLLLVFTQSLTFHSYNGKPMQ